MGDLSSTDNSDEDNPTLERCKNARDGNAEKVYEVLIKCPDLVNKPDNDGLTALHYATKYGNLEVVEVLLNFGANADVTSKELMTPLHMSAKAQLLIVFIILFATNYVEPSTKSSQLLKLTRTGKFDSSSRFKDNLSNSNRSMTVNSPIAIVDLLVRRGANVNAADAYGLTPLHYAAMKANTLTAQALLTNGANVNPKGVKGMTPLPTACIHGSDDIVRLLLSNGADCCDMDNRKNSVYHIAALHGRNNTLKLLLQYGKNAHVMLWSSNGEGKTPLRLAVEGDHPDTVQSILELKSTQSSEFAV
ncbi:ankyrin repeat protein [Dictyocaulus viviparus]|uniref:Ankyrin repeat protein n=1 Tax=Dictyocaulus viviparus TaxID=29172 RepID=A0A0D8XQ56_DICVI|nr:ankyrin repeat protein [Dictyocaulus viviparus]